MQQRILLVYLRFNYNLISNYFSLTVLKAYEFLLYFVEHNDSIFSSSPSLIFANNKYNNLPCIVFILFN